MRSLRRMFVVAHLLCGLLPGLLALALIKASSAGIEVPSELSVQESFYFSLLTMSELGRILFLVAALIGGAALGFLLADGWFVLVDPAYGRLRRPIWRRMHILFLRVDLLMLSATIPSVYLISYVIMYALLSESMVLNLGITISGGLLTGIGLLLLLRCLSVKQQWDRLQQNRIPGTRNQIDSWRTISVGLVLSGLLMTACCWALASRYRPPMRAPATDPNQACLYIESVFGENAQDRVIIGQFPYPILKLRQRNQAQQWARNELVRELNGDLDIWERFVFGQPTRFPCLDKARARLRGVGSWGPWKLREASVEFLDGPVRPGEFGEIDEPKLARTLAFHDLLLRELAALTGKLDPTRRQKAEPDLQEQLTIALLYAQDPERAITVFNGFARRLAPASTETSEIRAGLEPLNQPGFGLRPVAEPPGSLRCMPPRDAAVFVFVNSKESPPVRVRMAPTMIAAQQALNSAWPVGSSAGRTLVDMVELSGVDQQLPLRLVLRRHAHIRRVDLALAPRPTATTRQEEVGDDHIVALDPLSGQVRVLGPPAGEADPFQRWLEKQMGRFRPVFRPREGAFIAPAFYILGRSRFYFDAYLTDFKPPHSVLALDYAWVQVRGGRPETLVDLTFDIQDREGVALRLEDLARACQEVKGSKTLADGVFDSSGLLGELGCPAIGFNSAVISYRAKTIRIWTPPAKAAALEVSFTLPAPKLIAAPAESELGPCAAEAARRRLPFDPGTWFEPSTSTLPTGNEVATGLGRSRSESTKQAPGQCEARFWVTFQDPGKEASGPTMNE